MSADDPTLVELIAQAKQTIANADTTPLRPVLMLEMLTAIAERVELMDHDVVDLRDHRHDITMVASRTEPGMLQVQAGRPTT